MAPLSSKGMRFRLRNTGYNNIILPAMIFLSFKVRMDEGEGPDTSDDLVQPGLYQDYDIKPGTVTQHGYDVQPGTGHEYYGIAASDDEEAGSGMDTCSVPVQDVFLFIFLSCIVSLAIELLIQHRCTAEALYFESEGPQNE
jgi:hypothetical protein